LFSAEAYKNELTKIPDCHCEAQGAVAIPWEIPRVMRLPRFARNDRAAFFGLFTRPSIFDLKKSPRQLLGLSEVAFNSNFKIMEV